MRREELPLVLPEMKYSVERFVVCVVRTGNNLRYVAKGFNSDKGNSFSTHINRAILFSTKDSAKKFAQSHFESGEYLISRITVSRRTQMFAESGGIKRPTKYEV